MIDGMISRCSWAVGDAMMSYHDNEWGRPQHDDAVLYEFLVLEGAQAGLSWSTILNRRSGYKNAFANFDPHKVSEFDTNDVERLMNDTGIIRNRRKIESAINNAIRFVKVQQEYGSFDEFVWGIGGPTVTNNFSKASELPASTPVSHKMSKILKKRGFTFVGPVICYAFMQTIGIVNDHTTDCFVHQILSPDASI